MRAVATFVKHREFDLDAESLLELAGFGLLNALTFALPQLLWLSATLIFQLTSRVSDAGLVAADILLIAFGFALATATDPAAGGWLWLIYVPVATIVAVLTGVVAHISKAKDLTRRCS